MKCDHTSVLEVGIVLYCIVLYCIVLYWYRCLLVIVSTHAPDAVALLRHKVCMAYVVKGAK